MKAHILACVHTHLHTHTRTHGHTDIHRHKQAHTLTLSLFFSATLFPQTQFSSLSQAPYFHASLSVLSLSLSLHFPTPLSPSLHSNFQIIPFSSLSLHFQTPIPPSLTPTLLPYGVMHGQIQCPKNLDVECRKTSGRRTKTTTLMSASNILLRRSRL